MMVGLKDVARVAGVSVSTVSRVLTASPLVNEATRERVQRAMDELQYRPNRVARRLRRDTANASLIGLIVPDIQNPFFAELVRGVESVAQRHGYMVFLGNSDEDESQERRYLELMRAESVDGVILPASSDIAQTVVELARDGIPVVCVDRRLPRAGLDTVIADNVHGAQVATDHLLRVGHRRIGFIGGRPELSTSQERLQGYRQALQEHGLELDRSLVREGDSRQESGRRMAKELLEMESPPGALLVGNNLMTLGALEAIHSLGLRIPEDVAIVGYDDVPWALALNPPLTAIRQPSYEIGQRAAELLLRRIEEPNRSTTLVTLQPELVVRGSCGAGKEAKIRARTRRQDRISA
ncbi:MAG TPA: LacI family DNA-binding transcriptional regulator [Gemmatimonadaceae bacterium]|nr:LacI family DNA-binding transcriptional regulator [Gemmatimonadaceae bacterium]